MNRAPSFTQSFDRGIHRGTHLGIQAIGKIFGRNTHAQTLHRPFESLYVIRHRHFRGSGVQRIISRDHTEQNGSIPHGAGNRTNPVERGGKGDQAIARYTSVRRKHANDATKGCRLTNRSAGVGTEGGNRHACGHRCSRPTA